jgi:glycosyltransferase involved in cell wall biosynthesis
LRILMLVDCYYPSTKSVAKLVRDLGIEFHRLGNQVLVLTPSEAISTLLVISAEDGITIARVRTGKIKGASNVRRALEEMRLSSNLWSKARKFLHENPCDLIITYSPSIFFGPLVRKLKDLWGCPSYLILRDLFPQWAVDAGVLRRGLIHRFFRAFETYQYDVADQIAVQSPANLVYFAQTFPRKNYPLKVLHNWTALHEPNLPRTNFRTRLSLENKVVFFFGGSIGVAQDMDNLVRLGARLERLTNVHLLLVGNGSEVPRLNHFITTKGLRNITILPAVDQHEYLSMVSEFDVGLISLDRRLKTHNVPGKLLSYLFWGIPVLASLNPGNDLFDLLHENQAGLCFLNGDDDSFAAAAERLADDADLRAKLGQNARRLLERTFSVDAAAKQIFAHLQDAGLVFESSHLLEPTKSESAATPLSRQKVFN